MSGAEAVTEDGRRRAGRLRYRHEIPARTGVIGVWPGWLPPAVRARSVELGMVSPWQHQVQAAESLWAGRHVVLSTGTASGKTLAYLLPVLAATNGGQRIGPQDAPDQQFRGPGELLRPRRPHTALYLAPTKALAHDQLRVWSAFDLAGTAATLDGDTEQPDRHWARDYASYILTNPDMLHRSVLPQHQRWASFFRSLRFVVIDESHHYRGVFGAHVSAVIRRLRRVAALYGSEPTFALASATSAEPGASASALTGIDQADLVVVGEDTSARGAVEMLLWEPVGSPDDEAAWWLASLVDSGRQTIAFVSSRKAAERVAVQAAGMVTSGARVESYRGGYLAEGRRRLERALQTGTLAGVAATNALELGVDISGMDAVVISGVPATRAALWQQAGRAGRHGGSAQVVLIGRRQPLDAYFFDHPETLLSAPVESTVLHPDNPYVLGPHLAAAAQEAPLTEGDERFFGATSPALVDRLVGQDVVRRRAGGCYWTRTERAVDSIDLRSAGGASVDIVEVGTGRVLGHVDAAAADSTVHPGATYLHAGDNYLVEALDLELSEALVRAARPHYYTQPLVDAGVRIVSTRQSRTLGSGSLHLGTVDVTTQVTAYLRRDDLTGHVWDQTALDLPERTLRTQAVWCTLDPGALSMRLDPGQLAGGAHGIEHTAISLLPMFAPCDRWDVGGASDGRHPDTKAVTVFVHDGQAGGAGFAERGFDSAEAWLAATLQRLESCECDLGCPSCVVSPTCGTANQVLDKQAAMTLLQKFCL
ncbi:MAG TPA: DEAD/DEAH box helicase [Propionibacteriaceae bacterium]|nr:DEAD/DEAH box helicase [Propionibacteriaceae bacterium]